MRKVCTSAAFNQLTAEHPLATTFEHPLVTLDGQQDNDKAWSLMYKALVDGIGASPSNFQLIYPFTTWNWPVDPVGFSSAARYDFISTVPQWSATGQYVSEGTSFNDTYGQMLNVIKAATADPTLQKQIDDQSQVLALAQNQYDTTYAQATSTYQTQTGGTNDPTFTAWLGSPAGKSWNSRLNSAWANVAAQQDIYNQLLSETKTPGLNDAISRYNNKDYYTKYSDPSLSGFPQVPSYSTSMDPVTWVTKVKNGTAGSKGKITFSNRQSAYDYKNTWAGGSASINRFFWSVNVGGSWQRIDEFASDQSVETSIEFEAWDQVSISAGRWYNGAFVTSMSNGPFVNGYSAYGKDGTKAVWGENGVMSVQKVGMIVCYKPSFSIQVSSSSFQRFYEQWKVSSGLRIGPFEFSGGGGSTTDNWKADSSTNTFSGTSTGETPLILGVNVVLINPPK